MAEINENTKVAVKAGGVFGALLVVFVVGAWYGDLRNDRAASQKKAIDEQTAQNKVEAAQAKIDDRQDAAIAQMQTTITGMNTTLALIKQSQDTQMPTLIRQSTYATEVLRDIEVALAAKGILTKEHGP